MEPGGGGLLLESADPDHATVGVLAVNNPAAIEPSHRLCLVGVISGYVSGDLRTSYFWPGSYTPFPGLPRPIEFILTVTPHN